MLQRRLGIKAVECHTKYLGLSIILGTSEETSFCTSSWSRSLETQGVKEKSLSQTGREVLVKLVALAIPIYVMNCFLIRKVLCHEMETVISWFWWGKNQGDHDVYWCSWKNLCKSKREEDMGFHSLHEFNLAMLAKQIWRLLHSPASLFASLLKA